MISRVSHVTVWVQNQEEARKFYTEQLGFEIRFDATMENGFRWLTVGLKSQPDFEVILMEPKQGGKLDAESEQMLRTLLKKGVLGANVFQTPNCRETYAELKQRGVQFLEPPAEKFYGVEALLRDNSGNWFSMTEPKEMPAKS
jgi:catechol 2,3-dioxygenase-like lactoylglutathione lyase family enzyme